MPAFRMMAVQVCDAAHLLVEGGSGRPCGLLAKLGQHQRLAQPGAAVYVGVDPAARKAQRALSAALLRPRASQPGVRPEMDGCKVDAVRHVIAREVAALRQRVIGVIWQELCSHATSFRHILDQKRSSAGSNLCRKQPPQGATSARPFWRRSKGAAVADLEKDTALISGAHTLCCMQSSLPWKRRPHQVWSCQRSPLCPLTQGGWGPRSSGTRLCARSSAAACWPQSPPGSAARSSAPMP